MYILHIAVLAMFSLTSCSCYVFASVHVLYFWVFSPSFLYRLHDHRQIPAQFCSYFFLLLHKIFKKRLVGSFTTLCNLSLKNFMDHRNTHWSCYSLITGKWKITAIQEHAFLLFKAILSYNMISPHWPQQGDSFSFEFRLHLTDNEKSRPQNTSLHMLYAMMIFSYV